MDAHQGMVPFGNANQVGLDFGDQLPPGYRFSPTDSELIVYYLNAKIASRKLPESRFHEVNIYNHSPEELTERYRSSGDKWYFLSPRDRKWPNGDRPSRTVKPFGYWKATQRQREVRDASQQPVGFKTPLAFHDNENNKTMWLMHEYLSDALNIPSQVSTNKLNDWVLCKIYKHRIKKTSESNPANQANANNQEPNKKPPQKRKRESKNNDDVTRKKKTCNRKPANPEDAMNQEGNKKPPQKGKRVSKNSHRLGKKKVDDMVAPLSNNNINMVVSNQQSVENVHMIEGLTTNSMYTSSSQGLIGLNNGATRQPTASCQGWSSIQPLPFYQSTCNESNNIGSQFQNCASSSSMQPLDHVGAQPLSHGEATFYNPMQTPMCYQNPTSFVEQPPNEAMTTFQYSNYIQPSPYFQNQITSIASNRFQFSDGASTSSSSESPAFLAQPLDYGGYKAVLASHPVNHDDILRLHVQYQDVENSYEDPKTQLDVPSGSNPGIGMVVPHDVAQHIPSLDGDINGSIWHIDDADILTWGDLTNVCLEDLLKLC